MHLPRSAAIKQHCWARPSCKSGQQAAQSLILCTYCNQGFFYNRYPAPVKAGAGELGTETDSNVGQQLWYHVVGTSQSSDALVLEIPDQPEWQTSAQVTDDGRCASCPAQRLRRQQLPSP